jgi:hypothetical protein
VSPDEKPRSVSGVARHHLEVGEGCSGINSNEEADALANQGIDELMQEGVQAPIRGLSRSYRNAQEKRAPITWCE